MWNAPCLFRAHINQEHLLLGHRLVASQSTQTIQQTLQQISFKRLAFGNEIQKVVNSNLQLLASYKHLSVYAWGGTYPEYTTNVCNSLLPIKDQRPDKAVDLLRQLWPDCLIIEDKAFTRRGSKAFNYAEWLAGETAVVAEDERFVLMRLEEKQTPTVEYVKLVRHDYMKKNPQVVFSCALANTNEQATVWLELNGHDLGKWDLSDTMHEIHTSLPRALLNRKTPNHLRFYTHTAEGFFLRNFKMQPASDCES